jgi:hypothetical protein
MFLRNVLSIYQTTRRNNLEHRNVNARSAQLCFLCGIYAWNLTACLDAV